MSLSVETEQCCLTEERWLLYSRGGGGRMRNVWNVCEMYGKKNAR
jgi:hypothetical protein